MPRLLLSFGLGAVLFALISCDSSPGPESSGVLKDPRRFQVRGVLRKLTPDHRQAVIAHEDIAGYMGAMAMEFDLADPEEASSLVPGDIIAFRLSVTETKSWIDQIRKTGRTESPAPSETAPAPPAASAILPDSALIDQRGRSFHLNDLRGRALAITFIFTRCPLPNYCPLMSRNFEAVGRDLAAAVPADHWRLLSITIDPAHDTPEVLAAYAASYRSDPERWIFATGTEAEIRGLGSVFGLEFATAGEQINHNLRTVVVDPGGRIQKVFEGNDWQPAELVTEMQRAISARP